MTERKLRLQYIRALLNFRLLTADEMTDELTEAALHSFITGNAFPSQVNSGLHTPIDKIKAHLRAHVEQQKEANADMTKLLNM